jgi:hypothetical protein
MIGVAKDVDLLVSINAAAAKDSSEMVLSTEIGQQHNNFKGFISKSHY